MRNEPVQARSNQRVKALRDAARADVRELGRDLMTTAHIAQRAGASIGTVYRYYPDRVAVIRDLWPHAVDGLLDRPLADELRELENGHTFSDGARRMRDHEDGWIRNLYVCTCGHRMVVSSEPETPTKYDLLWQHKGAVLTEIMRGGERKDG